MGLTFGSQGRSWKCSLAFHFGCDCVRKCCLVVLPGLSWHTAAAPPRPSASVSRHAAPLPQGGWFVFPLSGCSVQHCLTQVRSGTQCEAVAWLHPVPQEVMSWMFPGTASQGSPQGHALLLACGPWPTALAGCGDKAWEMFGLGSMLHPDVTLQVNTLEHSPGVQATASRGPCLPGRLGYSCVLLASQLLGGHHTHPSCGTARGTARDHPVLEFQGCLVGTSAGLSPALAILSSPCGTLASSLESMFTEKLLPASHLAPH